MNFRCTNVLRAKVFTHGAARRVPGFFVMSSSFIIAGRDDEGSRHRMRSAIAG
jgi:hypothetical protein